MFGMFGDYFNHINVCFKQNELYMCYIMVYFAAFTALKIAYTIIIIFFTGTLKGIRISGKLEFKLILKTYETVSIKRNSYTLVNFVIISRR